MAQRKPKTNPKKNDNNAKDVCCAQSKGGTNGFAIAGFVTSLVGIPFLGLIFGYIALDQIKKRNQDGHGLALAGIIISFVYLGLALIGCLIALMVFFLLARTVSEIPSYYLPQNMPLNVNSVSNNLNTPLLDND